MSNGDPQTNCLHVFIICFIYSLLAEYLKQQQDKHDLDVIYFVGGWRTVDAVKVT